MKTITGCKVCGFPMEYRPNLFVENGVCGACINAESKKSIDFVSRQQWLTTHLKESKQIALNANKQIQYDCVVGVSGGKDSHMILKRLVQNHQVTNPLLVTTYDESTRTQAGTHNLNNISEHFDATHIIFRYKPQSCKAEMRACFESHLNPYMQAELRLGSFESEVVNIARSFGIRDVFYGEDASFEYGSSKECNIFHKDSTQELKFIFMGAIYPYGYIDSLQEAKSVGFKDLQDFHEWYRQGAVEHFAQIDSIGYMVQYWCKFVKFGAQRTTDMATRLCREGIITREQALIYINEYDHILDPLAKYDICQTMGISEKVFDKIVDSHANTAIVQKDANGIWRRKKQVV